MFPSSLSFSHSLKVVQLGDPPDWDFSSEFKHVSLAKQTKSTVTKGNKQRKELDMTAWYMGKKEKKKTNKYLQVHNLTTVYTKVTWSQQQSDKNIKLDVFNILLIKPR